MCSTILTTRHYHYEPLNYPVSVSFIHYDIIVVRQLNHSLPKRLNILYAAAADVVHLKLNGVSRVNRQLDFTDYNCYAYIDLYLPPIGIFQIESQTDSVRH